MLDVETQVNLNRIVKHTRISKAYDIKAIHYGKYIEILQYAKTKITFKTDNDNTRTGFKNATDGKKRDDSLARTRQNIYRITHCNAGMHGNFPTVFYTITFKENITDLQYANNQFKKFLQRLNYKLPHKLKYLFIPEFQKRGAVHYHGVFFNLPYIDKKEMENLWGLGFTRIETVKKINDIGSYISKYLGKNTFDNRLFGQRILMTSKGLFRPIEYYGSNDVDNLTNSIIIDKVIADITGVHRKFTKIKII